jgi:hypothetical protein
MKKNFFIEVTPVMKYYEPKAHQLLAEKVTSRIKSCKKTIDEFRTIVKLTSLSRLRDSREG